MNVKPILFNAEMVRSILDGRKTVTRRIPSKRIEDKWFDYEEWVTAVAPSGSASLTEKEFYEQYPPYHPGDILYVRETFCKYDDDHVINGKRYAYKSDATALSEKMRKEFGYKWRPSIHMPKEAARIFLKIKDIRVERLQCMSWDDICNEGVIPDSDIRDKFSFEMLRNKFKNIWDSTIKKSDLDRYGWGVNPWVWVIEFEACDKP